MKIPEYITKAEVKRVCAELGIRDWGSMKTPAVTPADAGKVLKALGTMGMKVDREQFRRGLEVELEHGLSSGGANVTNNHPLLTGKIVLAHFMESLDYYLRLEVAELEGDLHKAVASGNAKKAANYAKRLAHARAELARAELKTLK